MRFLWLTALGLSAARPALACGACVNQEVRVWLPFAGPLMVLCLLWAASVLVARRILVRRGVEAPRDASPFRSARRFILTGIPVYIGLVVLTLGSLLGPAFIVGVVWLVFVAVSTAKLRRRRERSNGDEEKEEEGAATEAERTPRMERLAPRRALCPRAARAALRLNGIFLALAVVAVPVSYLHARSTARMISLLSYPSSGTRSVLLPGLIAKGEPAVRPLIDASRRALARDDGRMAKRWVLGGTLHCLGRIGGPEAEAFLEEVVRERVDFADLMDGSWQKTACLAYAECAGKRGAPLLVEVHGRVGESAVREAREAVIEAIRLADPDAAAELVREREPGPGASP